MAVWVAGTLTAAPANALAARNGPNWYLVAKCETAGRWNWGSEHRPGEGHEYEGGVGFYWATWRSWAGDLHLLRRFPHAYDAPARVQIRVAQYGWEHGGWWGSLHNGCAG